MKAIKIHSSTKRKIIKVQPKYRALKRGCTSVPEIRFSGNWLTAIGFKKNMHVVIYRKRGVLVIERV